MVSSNPGVIFFSNRIAVYKALYAFGGYMSDVVAAVDKVCFNF